MKAMLLDDIAPIGASPLAFREVADPEPGAGEVRLRVRYCAICRTDLHVIEGDLPRAKLPVVPGHQIVGVVDRLGTGCTRWKLGERVGAAWLRHTCGDCRFCSQGRENLCERSRFTGYQADGGYAEFAIVDEAFAYAIPDLFDDAQATPLLCAGIIGFRALERSRLPRGGRLALVGFGSSAHIVLQIAQHRGSDVYVVTRGTQHRRLARDMGAVWVGEEASRMPEKVDSAIIFAPAGELVPQALAALEKGGTLALAGIHMSNIPAMNYEQSLFYERCVQSVTANTREDGRQLIEEAAQIPIGPRITTYPLQDANRALQDLKNDRINGTGVLVVE